jgi:hypothetical protein
VDYAWIELDGSFEAAVYVQVEAIDAITVGATAALIGNGMGFHSRSIRPGR